ncbi:MAG: DUF1326 domain-containing protein [Akkermansiaceae bacterium]|nr:DUF1326 domain-containing protein [Armatimonadota bacterium]
MKIIPQFPFSILVALTLMSAAGAAAPVAPPKGQWAASGTLLEACTCAVPCSCNFGEPPSPNNYCHAVYAYRLEKASWDGVDLSGLVIAGADGPKGGACFLDERATPAQRPALERLTRAVWAQGGPGNAPGMPFMFAKITPSIAGNDLKLKIGDVGGFTARVIVGRDGKTPVVVENNTVWPIARATKGKTGTLNFLDKNVGKISASGTNANYGKFTFGGASGTAAKKPAAMGACCGTHAVK